MSDKSESSDVFNGEGQQPAAQQLWEATKAKFESIDSAIDWRKIDLDISKEHQFLSVGSDDPVVQAQLLAIYEKLKKADSSEENTKQ